MTLDNVDRCQYMACFQLLQAIRLGLKPNGSQNIKIFKTRFKNYSVVHPDVDLLIPCGRCVGCRLERSRQWAVRCMHEASFYEKNCFITLTFNDEELLKREKPMSLDKADFQNFMKRLRKQYVPVCPYDKNDLVVKDLRKQWFLDNGIRYYMCGEYGDQFKRPHYHACLFNFNFPDLVFWKEKEGFKLYKSEVLEKLWPYGYSSVGSVTFESAAYVARYIMKKLTGKDKEIYYDNFDMLTGEYFYTRIKEYNDMSRHPGIGTNWFDKWGLIDVYPKDYIYIPGRGKMKPPRYYDNKLSEEMLAELKANRLDKALELDPNEQSPERLLVREKVASARLALFSRNVE